jgi:hypothetical protein
MFRAVWFSYAQLQQLDGDMKCPECGPTPETVIWDGVTLAFSRKHLLSSLRPPTTLDVYSATRHESVYRGRQQLLVDVTLRKLVRKIISGPSFPSAIVEGGDVEHGKNVVEGKQNSGGAKGDPKRKEASQAAEAALTHIELIGSATVQLKAVNQGLAEVFMEHFGFEAYSSGRKVPSVFRELFIQVCSLRVKFMFGINKFTRQGQISAEESVLQMATRVALQDLQVFNKNPTPNNASLLVTIPVLYNALVHERNVHMNYRSSVTQLCTWVHQRGMEVLNELLVHALPPEIGSRYEEMHWRSVSGLHTSHISHNANMFCWSIDGMLL